MQKSALAITPLAKKGSYLSTSQERPIYEYAAHTEAHFTPIAVPNTGALEFDNFIIPDGGTLTEAELGAAWRTETSPRAQAWQALAYDQQIPFLSKETPRPKLREKDFSVKIVGDDTNSEATKAAIQTLIEQNKIPEFHVDTVPPQIERLNDVQTKMLEGADAVVLAFDPARAQEDFWRNVWTFSSLVVGEQTRDKYKLEKPVYLINPKEGDHAGAFDYLEKLTQDLHVLGTISEDPDMLYRSAATPEEAIEGLKAHRESKNHLRYDPPAYSRGDEILESTGNSSTKDFNVAIFISATNENDMIINTGSYLAKKLAEEGIGVTSGAGMFSGMGGITKSMQTLPDDVEGHHTGITTPHIANEREIKGADGQNIADKFVLTRDIYARIEGLLNVDAAIVAPGGMGTVQEMAGFALLKKMALEDPEHTYTKEFTNKELVLINIPIAIGGKKRHFYDALIDVIPPDQLAPLGIHIVETPEQAMDKMRELREEKKQREREEAATRGR